jgi:hypothetical protein
MLRIHLVQHWFNLSDPGVEDALYDSPIMGRFAGIDLGAEPVRDEITILRFRHLLEAHELAAKLFGGNIVTWNSGGSSLPSAPLWMPPSSMHPSTQEPGRQA